MRKETRGSHWREDFPDTDDEYWHVRLVDARSIADGVLVTTTRGTGPGRDDLTTHAGAGMSLTPHRASPRWRPPVSTLSHVEGARCVATVAEDLDGGVDVTSAATVPADQRSTMDLVDARHAGVAAGDPGRGRGVRHRVRGRRRDVVVPSASDGAPCLSPATSCSPSPAVPATCSPRSGPSLNLLCHLSGVATATAAWADALDGTVDEGPRHP